MSDPRPLGPDVSDWRSQAACRMVDPGLFFPDGRGLASLIALEEARAVCGSCPVREACYDHGLHHELYGFWGGSSEHQRKLERRRLGIALATPEGRMAEIKSVSPSALRQRARREQAS